MNTRIAKLTFDHAAVAQSVTAAAAGVLRERYTLDARIESFEDKDIKTVADQEAERLIRKLLKPTGIPVLGEEQGGDVRFRDRMWVVDPLDGTMNFTRGFPEYCVSVSLWDQGAPVAGAVRSVVSGKLLEGACGGEVHFDGEPVLVSNVSDMGQAIFATGFPSGRNYESGSLTDFVFNVQRFKKVRMIGSAAMSISYVARGVFDAYSEEDIFLWDVAAGIALVKAAGGRVFATVPKDDWKMNVWADNGKLSVRPAWEGTIEL